uniref:Uncharacterized protein n=2 Tax=Caenorhabditis japonica TaxID=281687 RepID=A0A8R1I763_CAEJA
MLCQSNVNVTVITIMKEAVEVEAEAKKSWLSELPDQGNNNLHLIGCGNKRCNTLGDCVYTEKPKKKTISCLCATPIKMCVRIDPPQTNATTLDDRLVKFWHIQPSTTVSPTIKRKEERDKAYGYTVGA